MIVDDVRRLDLGTFVRPAEETDTGRSHVEAAYGYVVPTPAGVLLLDTGVGDPGGETEAWYRPRRVPVDEALAAAGLTTEDTERRSRVEQPYPWWEPSPDVGTNRPGRRSTRGVTMRGEPGAGPRGRLPGRPEEVG
jgi:hypothetical protein